MSDYKDRLIVPDTVKICTERAYLSIHILVPVIASAGGTQSIHAVRIRIGYLLILFELPGRGIGAVGIAAVHVLMVSGSIQYGVELAVGDTGLAGVHISLSKRPECIIVCTCAGHISAKSHDIDLSVLAVHRVEP